eukprot:191978-Pleurochrysis_carterae.AAC.2
MQAQQAARSRRSTRGPAHARSPASNSDLSALSALAALIRLGLGKPRASACANRLTAADDAHLVGDALLELRTHL